MMNETEDSGRCKPIRYPDGGTFYESLSIKEFKEWRAENMKSYYELGVMGASKEDLAEYWEKYVKNLGIPEAIFIE